MGYAHMTIADTTGSYGRREIARRLGGAAALAAVGTAPGVARAAPRTGGAITVATVGEPPTLDPMDSPADVVGMIAQHMFETLYTWGDGWRIVPLLAAADPEISADGRTYTIPLRTGVKFHNGAVMTSADVLASLNRWMGVAVRGHQTQEFVEAITAPDAKTIRIALKQPFAPLLSLLSLQTSAAIILPAGKQAQPMTEFIGTGPFSFAERMPDRYIRLRRFDGYVARDDAPNAYGGKRTPYVDEVRFVPVPNATTRVDGSLTGEYDYADSLPVEMLPRLKAGAGVEPLVFRSFGWPFFFLNAKQGPLANVALRRAVLASLGFEDMLRAAFGSKEFYEVDGAWYPAGYALHSDAGAEVYRAAGDAARARKMADDAGYRGEKIRIMVSQQYDFHYKMAEVAVENMKQAGIAAETYLVDWATLLQQRNDPGRYELFVTHGPVLPEPTLYSFMTPAAPGWWASPGRDKAVDAFSSEPNPSKRAALWGDLQKLIYDEVPVIRIGNFNALAVRNKRLAGVTPAVWPFFWNTWIEG
jgi:peptide/nickel transport system substrate-binding protein